MKYVREPGYFLGSIYFNYGLTALITMALFFGLYFGAGVPAESMKWPLGAFCMLFPVWFIRYARALWLGFDVYWDPASGGTPSATGGLSASVRVRPAARPPVLRPHPGATGRL